MAGFSALSVAGLGIVFVFTLRADVSEVIQEVSVGFLLLAVLATVADSLIGALRYHIFLRRLKPGTPLSLSLRADLVGRFTGAVTPSQTGGGPGQVFTIFKGGFSVPDILSVLMVNFVSTLVFFLLVGSVALWLVGDQFSGSAIQYLIQWAFVAFLGAMAFIGLSLTRPDLLARPLQRLARRLAGNEAGWARATRRASEILVESTERYKESCVRCVRESSLLPLGSVVLTTALYFNKFTLAWFLVKGLGVDAPYTTTLAVQALLHFILYVAPTPGGSGIAELSTGALMAVLLPTHLLGPFTLAFHFFLKYLPATVGGVLLALALHPRKHTALVAQRVAAAGLVLALVGSTMWPGSITAQAGPTSREVRLAPVRALHPLEEDPAAAYSRRMGLVRSSLELGVVATSHADSLAAYSVAVDTAWALVLMAPDDADAHYIYAVALGQRLELSGTREKIRLGAVTRREAEAALALDPDHAGAHHVLGRLNAATMRLGFVARFIARRVLGASAMDGASWELAEYHFTRARDLEPENPRHLMELGALYSDTHRQSEALEALAQAIAAPRVEVGDSLAAERAIQLMASLDCRSCGR